MLEICSRIQEEVSEVVPSPITKLWHNNIYVGNQ